MNYLTNTERKIANYVLENYDQVLNSNITELAAVSYTHLDVYKRQLCVITTAGGVYFFRKKDLK